MTIDENSIITPTMKSFNSWYIQEQVKPLIAHKVEEYENRLSKVKGFIGDVDAEQERINNDLIDNIVQKNEKMREIDLALKSIMKGGKSKKEWS